jgi:hypothetical protein
MVGAAIADVKRVDVPTVSRRRRVNLMAKLSLGDLPYYGLVAG